MRNEQAEAAFIVSIAVSVSVGFLLGMMWGTTLPEWLRAMAIIGLGLMVIAAVGSLGKLRRKL